MTTKEQSWSFQTYEPLHLLRHNPSQPAPPCSGWQLVFNNPLDLGEFDANVVQVSPEPANLSIEPGGGGCISIRGATKGRTAYQVCLPVVSVGIPLL